MASRIQFDGDLVGDGPMLQWRGRNIGDETLEPGSTHDYLLLFDSDNQLVTDENVTRQGTLAPGDTYESFSYLQLPDGTYGGYLTLDQDGDEGTVADRQREIRIEVTDSRVVVQ